jgi:AcrR family transcriptional regulator
MAIAFAKEWKLVNNVRKTSHLVLAFRRGWAMRRKSAVLSSRKLPRQERSRLTVSAIIQATAQILVTRGYDAITTDAVAERAGVSIGSLYQYFPNKESLVAALIRDHAGEILGTVRAALLKSSAASPEMVLRALIHAGIEAHRINPELHRVLYEQVPREVYPQEALLVSRELQSLIEGFLRARAPDLSRQRTRMVAFMVETIVESLTHRAVVEAPDWLRYGHLEKEAASMLVPYLAEALR